MAAVFHDAQNMEEPSDVEQSKSAEESATEEENAPEKETTAEPEPNVPASPERPVTPVGFQPPQGQGFSPGVYRRLCSGLYQRDDTASASASTAPISSAAILGETPPPDRSGKSQRSARRRSITPAAVTVRRGLRVL
jgi:hypothetical protein